MILKFRVYEQTISLQATKSEPRQGSRDYLELQFSFSPDWNDLLKYVYIQHGEVSVPHDLVDGSVIVDEYFTEQTEFNVTLFGKSADGSIEVPTNVITVLLKESNNLWVKDAPEPQNSWFVQVADARDEALAAAVRAENAAIHQPYPNEETGTWWVWSAETGKYEDTGESYGVGGGTSDHTELSNRDAADQHPMSAITGLEDALDSKQPTGNYLTKELDPTVPEWAKQPQKPAYTAQEVGALPDTTKIPSALSELSEDTIHRVVTDAEKAAWNAKSNFSGSYNDLTDKPTIPGAYTLPIASSTKLGGVKPVAKTDAMTQSVGVDTAGGLWAVPGSGGGSGGVEPTAAEKIVEYTADADGAAAHSFTFTVEEYPKLAEYNHLRGIVKKTANGSMPWVNVILNDAATQGQNGQNIIGATKAASASMFGFEITKNSSFYMGKMVGPVNPSLYSDWLSRAFPYDGAGRLLPLKLTELQYIVITSYTTFLDEGGTIEIWGWND